MRVRQSNDLIHWIRFFLQGVTETATKGRDVFRQILILRNNVEQQILSLGKRAPNAKLLLNLLYRRPITTAQDIEQQLNLSTPTVNALLKDFLNLGILVEMTGQQRFRIYEFKQYFDLFIE